MSRAPVAHTIVTRASAKIKREEYDKKIGIEIPECFAQFDCCQATPPPSALHLEPKQGPDKTLVAEAACHGARTLTEGGNIAYIVLVGQAHTLRINRVGKLILTKRSIPAIIGVTDAALSSGCIFIAPRCVHSTP